MLRTGAAGAWLRPAPRHLGRSVELAIGAAILGAWIALIVIVVAGGPHHDSQTAGMAGMPGMAAMPGMSGMDGMSGMAGMAGMSGMPAHHSAAGGSSSLLGSATAAAIAMWALMVVAMMLPAALPAVRHVAVNSLLWRRRRAMATFAAVYLSIWVAFGALLLLISPLWSPADPAIVLAVALAVAAAWQLTPHKRRALLDCHRPSPLPPRGRRATAGVVRFASFNGLACVRSCWAMMLAMGVASSLTLFWMIAITGLVTTEKLAPKPRQASHAAAVVLAAGALLAAVL